MMISNNISYRWAPAISTNYLHNRGHQKRVLYAGWPDLGIAGTEHVASRTSARDVFAAAQKAVTA